MPTDNNGIVTSTVCVGQSIAFTQYDNFVSTTGQLAASLDERSLVYINFPSMLCGLQNTAFHLINGSDKLEHYTRSLKS